MRRRVVGPIFCFNDIKSDGYSHKETAIRIDRNGDKLMHILQSNLNDLEPKSANFRNSCSGYASEYDKKC